MEDPGSEYAFTVKGVQPLRWITVRNLLKEDGISLTEQTPEGEMPIQSFTTDEVAKFPDLLKQHADKLFQWADEAMANMKGTDDPDLIGLTDVLSIRAGVAQQSAEWFEQRMLSPRQEEIVVKMVAKRLLMWGVLTRSMEDE
jgi:hypothetical protein